VTADNTARLGRLSLLASAICGRPVLVAPAEPGESVWTDGTVVFVGAEATPRERLEALAVQASLIAAGSLEPAIVRRLAARPGLARRYLAIEGHRALAASEDVLPPPVLSLIDRRAAARAGTPAASLAVARGRQPVADPPACFGMIRPRRLLAAQGRRRAPDPADEGAGPARPLVAEAAAEITRPLWRAGPGPNDGADDAAAPRPRDRDAREHDADADGGNVGPSAPPFASLAGGSGALAWLFRRMLRAGRAAAGGGPLGARTEGSARGTRGAGHGTALAIRPAAVLDEFAAAPRQAATYPEWDVFRGRYRPDWCTVDESDQPPAPGAPLQRPDGRALRRPLARLGMGLDRCRRELQGEEVDIDAAIQARVDAVAQVPCDDAVYIASLRRRRELAVLVLLDISGSSAEPGEGSGTVHEQQRAAAGLLTAALHGLGDRVALYGFCSQGRSAVHLVRVKSFGDDLDTLVLRRLGGLVPGGFTRLGAAIRHSASVLEERGGTSRRLLVVLSDGLAYDHGYERRYGEADARRALDETRRRGTGCLCVTVGAATDAVALRRVFGTAAHASVARPEQLAAVIGPLLGAALRSAEFRRRMSQRESRARERRTAGRRTA